MSRAERSPSTVADGPALAVPRESLVTAVSTVLRNRTVQWLVLGALACVLLYAQANDARLRGDSLSYAAISRSITQTGDFFHLTRGGEPYYNKPPLSFWLSALTMKVLGPTVFAASFWARAFAVGCVFLTGWLGRRFWGERHGWFAAFILLTSPPFLRNATVFRLDSILTFGILVSLVGLLRGERRSGPFLFFGGMAIAILGKGPAGLLPLILAPVYVVAAARSLPLRRWLLAAPLLLLPAAWWILLHFQNEESVSMFVSGAFKSKRDFSRAEQFWENYVVNVVKTYWPWLPLALLGTAQSVRDVFRRRAPRGELSALWLALAWIGVVVVSCALMPAQYTRYILPALPASSLLAARLAASWVSDTAHRWIVGGVFAFVVIATVGLTCLPINVRAGEPHRYRLMGELIDARLPPESPLIIVTTRTGADGEPKLGQNDRPMSRFHFGRALLARTPEDLAASAGRESVVFVVASHRLEKVAARIPLRVLVQGRDYTLSETADGERDHRDAAR